MPRPKTAPADAREALSDASKAIDEAERDLLGPGPADAVVLLCKQKVKR